MFSTESDFIQGKITSKFARGGFESPSNQMKFEDIYPEEGEVMPGGMLTGSSTSRARLFSQQRELMAKKRQSQRQNDGMIRRSTAANLTQSEQFTPAIRQFSAPKSISMDASEFAKSNPLRGNKNSNTKSASNSDEEGMGAVVNDEETENHPNAVRSSAERKPSYKLAKPLSQERYMDDAPLRYPLSSSNSDELDLGFDDSAVIDLYAQELKGSKAQQPQTPKSQKKRKSRHTHQRQRGENSEQERSSADEAMRQQQPPPQSDKKEKSRRQRTPRKQDKSSSKEGEELLNRSQEAICRPFVLDLSNMKKFLTSPIPRHAGVVQCYIRRNTSGTNRLYPKYSLFMKDGDVFLMSSKKRPNNKTSNYLISMDQQDLSRQGPSYLGKVRSNFIGTEYQIFDDGVNPKDCDGDEAGNPSSNVRCELGAVTYAATFTTSAPRKMQVAIPSVDAASGKALTWKDNNGPNGESDDLLTRIKDRNWSRDCHYYINKPPRWNDQIGGYVLNFHGRVTMASVKNFQLVHPDEQGTVTLQFGKVSKDEFSMDVQYPMTLFQAFAIVLTSFDSKIACD